MGKRYFLRNQDKIKDWYDEEVLDRMIKSLDEAFKGYKYPVMEVFEGERYPVITINDLGHTFGDILFYVISMNEGVMKLAYKEFIN